MHGIARGLQRGMVLCVQPLLGNVERIGKGADIDGSRLHNKTVAIVEVSVRSCSDETHSPLIVDYIRFRLSLECGTRYLNMTITPTSGIRKQDGARGFIAVAENSLGFEIAFEFLITNIKEISEYYGDGFSTIAKMVDSVTTYMNKDYHLEQLDRFVKKAQEYGLKSAEGTIQLAIEKVKNNIHWRSTSYYQLKTFLETLVPQFRINMN